MYVKQAGGEQMAVVRRPDRRVLLEFLHGTNTQIPKSIDKTVRQVGFSMFGVLDVAITGEA